jgi:hypothetical protein
MWMRILALLVCGIGFLVEPVRGQGNSSPTIQHEPVTVAVKGQSVSVLARVTPGKAPIKTVTLNYTPSRDAAPLQQQMTPSNGGVYVATIPAENFVKATSLSYYIEAVDNTDEWAETKWHQVQIRSARSARSESGPEVIDRTVNNRSVQRVEANRDVQTTRVSAGRPVQPQREGVSTTTTVLGGVLAAGAGVAIAAAAGGGGGGTPAPAETGGGETGSGEMGGSTGGVATNVVTCATEEVVGTWIGVTDPALAPGFALFVDNSAQFLIELGGVPEIGSWTLVDCDLTLFPPGTNFIYRGTGTLSENKNSLTVNGFTYRKGG